MRVGNEKFVKKKVLILSPYMHDRTKLNEVDSGGRLRFSKLLKYDSAGLAERS
jgi:hypothetical protein